MEYSRVNLNTVGVKAKSKAELYRTLVTEGKMYLTPMKECGLDFISEICVGKKKVLYCDMINVCQVPHLKGLRTEHLIDLIVNDCEGEDYLPSNYLKYRPNRSWLCKISNTLNKDGFENLVSKKMMQREEHLLEKKSLTINMDKRIAAIFTASMNVSVERGKSHKLLCKAIIREERDVRVRRQLELEKVVGSVPSLKVEISQLRSEIRSKEEEIEKSRSDTRILEHLFDLGVIDGDGNLYDQRHSNEMN